MLQRLFQDVLVWMIGRILEPLTGKVVDWTKLTKKADKLQTGLPRKAPGCILSFSEHTANTKDDQFLCIDRLVVIRFVRVLSLNIQWNKLWSGSDIQVY